MKHFETMVARYNSTLPTLSDTGTGEGQELQLTNRGVLIVTMKDDDGSNVIVTGGDVVSGGNDRGFICYGINDSGEATAHSMDSNGYLEVNVKDGNIDVDYTPGIDFDEGSDEAGAESEPGVISNITQSYRDIVSIGPLTGGKTYALTAFDASCDVEGQFQLVVASDSGSQYVRTLLIPENQGTNQLLFPRAKEIYVNSWDSNTYLKLKGKSLRAGRVMTATGGINVYERDAVSSL